MSWVIYLMPVIGAPLIWMGIAQALAILIVTLSAFGLVEMREGDDFETRLHAVSAGLTVITVIWLYAEIAGVTNFLGMTQ